MNADTIMNSVTLVFAGLAFVFIVVIIIWGSFYILALGSDSKQAAKEREESHAKWLAEAPERERVRLERIKRLSELSSDELLKLRLVQRLTTDHDAYNKLTVVDDYLRAVDGGGR